jgi:hypothetical protein
VYVEESVYRDDDPTCCPSDRRSYHVSLMALLPMES